MSKARRVALDALLDITERGAYANLCLKEALRGLPERDARWVSAAVYTALDHLLYLDYILDHFAKGRLQPPIRGVLRLGVTQVLYMDVPDSAACNESVELCKQIGKGKLSGYVNGVLRAICRSKDSLPALPQEPVERLSIQYSWPQWLVSEYVGQYGSAFTEALFCAKAPGMTLRAQWPYTTAALKQALQERDLVCTQGDLLFDALRMEKGLDVTQELLFLEGKATVQSESAMLVCRLLSPKPGMRILDACAAPGGKTAYLSHLMEGKGHIDAWEIHPHRLALMENTIRRLHVQNAHPIARDAAISDPALFGAYDAVLIDAPCSGLGVLGKPDARYAKNDAIVAELAALQQSILSVCAAYVRPGGVLVYATCTISHRENEDQIRPFLAAHDEFEPGNMDDLPASIWERAKDGMVQLFPHMDHTEGFFMAKMVKKHG
ncbi:MAG: 16S rRNA (cytosine(967)-C(5))-methyltransferase RsmB [Candidatus Pelethousia sp.]|nr:16S rRNA (cytosine(967)-C(5))-methyltransferase RsmB [Candidatus Pelethousia sp.]